MRIFRLKIAVWYGDIGSDTRNYDVSVKNDEGVIAAIDKFEKEVDRKRGPDSYVREEMRSVESWQCIGAELIAESDVE